jgi:hypothetical protein
MVNWVMLDGNDFKENKRMQGAKIALSSNSKFCYITW